MHMFIMPPSEMNLRKHTHFTSTRLCRRPLVEMWKLMVMAMLTLTTEAAVDSGLIDSDRTTIVDTHNTYRSQVGASNMLQMRWNYVLEQKAAEWVDKCNFFHQPNPAWGENLFRSSFDQPKLDIIYSGLESWNLERAFYLSDPRCCDAPTNTTLCCSYTQMVWAPTRDVGCAIKRCPLLTAADINYNNAWFLACYYESHLKLKGLTAEALYKGEKIPGMPLGNIQGFEPFVMGQQCADCPFTSNTCIPSPQGNGLCAPSPFCKNLDNLIG